MLELLPNDCLQFGKQRYRYLNSVAGFCYFIDIDDRIALPVRWSPEDLRNMVASGGLRAIDKVMPVRPHTERSKDRRRGVLRYHHVQALICKPGIMDKAPRGAAIREYARKSGVSKDALLDWLRKFWQGGQCQDAVMSNYHLSGKVSESTPGAIAIHIKEEGQEVVRWISGSPMPRGRRPRSASGSKSDPPRYTIYSTSQAEKMEIARIAWEHYGSDKSKSMDGAVTCVLSEKYIKRDNSGNAMYDEDGDPILLPKGQRPTEHQIREILEATKSLSSAYKSRYGVPDYNNNIKPRVGSVMDDCNGPGDVYEVDATILDVYVVDRDTRQAIIGKPTFYLVTDRASRLIVGFHVSLDNASWNEAKQAILNISADWKALAKRLKVKVKARDLIARGRFPNRFVADRGNDLLHNGSELLGDGLEIQVTNTRALSSVSKAIVESHFKGTQTALRQFAPGYEPPEDLGERRVKPHAKSAAMTLDALRRVLMRLIIARNRIPVNGYRASAREIFLKQSLSPLDIWQRGIETMTSYGSRFPYSYVKTKLTSRATAAVLPSGLKFGHCYYDSPEIREWRVRATLRDGFPVDVLFESSCVNEVVVLDPKDSSKSFVAKQIDARWTNYSFAERHVAYLQERQNNLLAGDIAQNEKVIAYLETNAVYAVEQELTTEANRDTTFGSRKTAGKAAREDEKKDRRLETHALFQPDDRPASDSAGNDDSQGPGPEQSSDRTNVQPTKPGGSNAGTAADASRHASHAPAQSDATAGKNSASSSTADDGDTEARGHGLSAHAESDDVLEMLLRQADELDANSNLELEEAKSAGEPIATNEPTHSSQYRAQPGL